MMLLSAKESGGLAYSGTNSLCGWHDNRNGGSSYAFAGKETSLDYFCIICAAGRIFVRRHAHARHGTTVPWHSSKPAAGRAC